MIFALKSRVRAQGKKKLWVAKHEGRVERLRDAIAEESSQQLSECSVARRMVQGVAHCESQTPARPKNAHHFPKRGAAVLEEHETELADDCIKTLA